MAHRSQTLTMNERSASYENHRMSTPPDFMHSSTGSMSMSAAARAQQSHIAKSYRQAAQLFLTRRLPEALSTIEPIIVPEGFSDPNADGDDYNSHQDGGKTPAPIATASKGTRVKVWSFYLTFLNAVIELGPEEGKHAFGGAKWRAMVNKARDGSIWEEVVQHGYNGNEGAVDHDVVINLATLLLTHSPSQKLTQTRLETYLSALLHPTFDITSHMAQSQSRSRQQQLNRYSSASGTNTPRDLATHLKILELYTLHVLPRNGEWEYAREFIMMSETMDDERKETFLQALHGLKEEQESNAIKEREIQKRQREEQEEGRQREEMDRREQERRRESEEERRRMEESRRKTSRPPPSPTDGAERPTTPTKQTPSSSSRIRTALSPSPTNPASRSKLPPNKKDLSRRPAPASIISRAAGILSTLQSTLLATASGLRNNPMALLRTMLFLLAFALAFGRQEIRERVRRMVAQAGDKVRATVGMGMKVSYI